MGSRSARFRYLNEMRQPRYVTEEIGRRCQKAVVDHGHALTDSELAVLGVVLGAAATKEPVVKADLDKAMGILGRFSNSQQGKRK